MLGRLHCKPVKEHPHLAGRCVQVLYLAHASLFVRRLMSTAFASSKPRSTKMNTTKQLKSATKMNANSRRRTARTGVIVSYPRPSAQAIREHAVQAVNKLRDEDFITSDEALKWTQNLGA
jgi:hypothetical protein